MKNEMSRRGFLSSVPSVGGALAVSKWASRAFAFPATLAISKLPNEGVIAETKSDIVETAYGRIRGSEKNGIKIFRGIPFGADTAGKNRFFSAKPPEPWSHVLPTLWYGTACPWQARAEWKQRERAFVQQWNDGYGRSENLLSANVWTPGINDNKRRPVLVYVHGGAYSWGSSYELPAYDGENLARRGDLIVVSMQHRLGVFGFLNLSGLKDPRFAHSNNLGISDIIFLLEWVRDNIANFGGDPGNVTIAGQSGGGGKVSILLSMPSAKGLFHKACVHSGSMLHVPEPETSFRIASAVLKELQISDRNSDALQSISSEHLLQAALTGLANVNASPTNGPDTALHNPRIGFGPYVDGEVITTDAFHPNAPDISADIPMFVCTTLNEFTDALDQPKAFSLSTEDLGAKVESPYPGRSREIIDVFQKGHPKANNFQIWSIISTVGVRASAIKQCQAKAALRRAPAYNCWWQWQSPILDGRIMAFHSGDLAFFFDNLERCQAQTGNSSEAQTLASQMSDAWIHFIRTGNPNHAGLPKWDPVTPGGSETMILDAPNVYSQNPDGDERRIAEVSRA
jgi:para-nitrobenzyl esterase